MSEWEKKKLGDLFSVKHGFAFKGKYFCDEETPELLVTPGNFSTSGGFQDTKKKYYNGPIPEDYVLHSGDLVITMTDLSKQSDTLGFGALIPKDENIWLHNQRIGLVELNDEKCANLKFLNYLLRSRYYRGWIIGSATGTTVKHTAPKKIESFECDFPPLPEQKAIAHVLGKLDDKIELNRKMNETLEGMAQALFKSWFVDFDPVLDNALAAGNPIPEALQSKAERRKAMLACHSAHDAESPDQNPGTPLIYANPELAQQFPDRFTFNETLNKWIPEGWGVEKIGDVATVIGGGTPSTKVDEYFTDDGIPWLSPKDLSGYSWKYISRGASDISELGLKNSSAKLMPSGTVLFSSRAPIGYIAIAENSVSTNQGFKSLVPNKGVPSEYLYYFLRTHRKRIENVASGSTFKEVSGSSLKGVDILKPSDSLLTSFSTMVESGSSKSLLMKNETETLTKLRDTLLPQLISGKVRLPEEFVGEFGG